MRGTRLTAERRRAQLLDVAGQLFGELGYHGVSMEQLADAAGVSKPVLYQHFPSKRDLYLALVRDTVGQLEHQVRGALEGTTDNRARVECAIGAYFDFVEDPRWRLLSAAGSVVGEDVRAAVEGAQRRLSEAIGALIAADAGLGTEAASFLAEGVRGLATVGAEWWLDHADRLDKAEAVRLLSGLAWRGLGSFQPSE